MTIVAFRPAVAVCEQVAFLWSSRGSLTRSSAVTFELLARFDNRVSDLLSRLGGDERLPEKLVAHEPRAFKAGFAFATAAVASLTGASHLIDALAARIESDASLLPAVASALAWSAYTQIQSTLEYLLAAPSPERVELGLWAAASHRMHPGEAVVRALEGETSRLRACALAVIGRLGLQDLRPSVVRALQDEDAACRFAAAWSAVRLGESAGIPVLGRFVSESGRFAVPACQIALRTLDVSRARRALERVHSAAGGSRLSVIGAGIVGDPTLADWLLDSMASEELARRAAAAFSLMTGCDLRRDDLDAANPPRKSLIEARRNDARPAEPADVPAPDVFDGAFVDDESDDELTWPDVVRLRRWWRGKRQGFRPGERYIAGTAVRDPALGDVLRSGNQAQRRAAALELALLNPQAPLFDVAAPAHHQLARLSGRRGA